MKNVCNNSNNNNVGSAAWNRMQAICQFWTWRDERDDRRGEWIDGHEHDEYASQIYKSKWQCMCVCGKGVKYSTASSFENREIVVVHKQYSNANGTKCHRE